MIVTDGYVPLFPKRKARIRKAGKNRFRTGSYTPAELGLDMPEVSLVHIGFCIKQGMDNGLEGFVPFFGQMSLAHCHQDAQQNWRGKWSDDEQVCVISGLYVSQKPGKVEDTMMHEYCHALAGARTSLLEGFEGHGPTWARLMEEHGLKPYASSAHVYR